MNSQLTKLFESIELQRLEILEQVRQSPEKFNVKPRENKWSIGQILAHIVTAEKLTLQYMTKKIQGIDQAGTTGRD